MVCAWIAIADCVNIRLNGNRDLRGLDFIPRESKSIAGFSSEVAMREF